jgi:carboxymethylenebutenolidase
MITDIAFSTKGDKRAKGISATPSGSGKAGAVVLLQEWWGINANMRGWTERLASEGFVAVTPDLYHGTIAKNAEEAGRLMNALDTLAAVEDIAGAVAYAKEHARSNGKVAVMGFCMGGALSFASACHVPGLAAVVPFYGIPPAEKVDYAKVTAPIQAHFAKKDGWAKPSLAQDIQKKLETQGKSMELFVYDADHAFMNDARPEVYDAACAKLALERTLAFLRKHLG